MRRPFELGTARSALTARDVGARRSLLGPVSRVKWIERPRKPYSFAVLEDSGAVVFVPHKSLRSHGVGAGRQLWAKGTVKRGKLGPYLEIEFEGPGTNRNEFWEDWLAVLARPAYDLHPATLLADWELSRLDRPSGRLELLARIT